MRLAFAILLVSLTALPCAAGPIRKCRLSRLRIVSTYSYRPRHGSEQSNPIESAPLTLEEKVKRLFRDAGFQHGLISANSVNVNELSNFVVGNQWGKVQSPLQDLFQQELSLDYKPQLILVLRHDKMDTSRGSFVFTHPGDVRIVEILSRELNVPSDMFDERLKLIGEMGNFNATDFKRQFLKDEQPDLAKIQGAILDLLQSDIALADLATKARGGIKPIDSSSNLTPDRARVITEWQQLAGDDNLRLYWRLSITLSRQPMGHWQLESLVDIGQRYRSQAFTQIRKVSDTNRLAAFDNLNSVIVPDGTELTTVKQKVVVSAAESLLSEDARHTLGELAPTLWTKVKARLFKEE